MKERLSNTLHIFTFALGVAALGTMSIALILVLYDIPRTVSVAAVPWALMLLALALISELLISRGTNMLIYAAACVSLLFFGSEYVVRHTVFIPGSAGFPVLLRLIIWASGAAAAYAAQKLPSSNAYVRLGDMLIAAAACYLCAVFFLGDALMTPVLAFVLCAIAACLLSTAALRAGGESGSVIRGTGAGGLVVLLALLLVCALLCSALLSLASGRVDGLVSMLIAMWNMFTRVISYAFELFVRLVALFAPKPVTYSMAPVQEDSLALSVSGLEVSAQMPRFVIYLFIALIVLLLAAAAFAILWMMRKTKLSRQKTLRTRRVTRQSHMCSALRAWLHALCERLSFELAYRHNRRMPQGLYVLAVRSCRSKRLKKRPGESPGAYIRRLHAALLAQSGMSTLDALAAKLDRTLYAGEHVPLSHGESDAFAAQIAALRAGEKSAEKRPASP